MKIPLSLEPDEARALITIWRNQIGSLQTKIQNLESLLQTGHLVREETLDTKASPSSPIPPPAVVTNTDNQTTEMPRGKNFRLVYDYLKVNGPSGVTSIGAAIEIPKTSVSSVVRGFPKYFVKRDGLWGVAENGSQALSTPTK